MPQTDTAKLPNIGEILAPILARMPREHQPLLIAIAERRAAERYRGWANDPASVTRKAALLACAEREEQIAALIESLYADAPAIARDILAKNPDLEEVNRSIFAGRPLEHQFAIQAQGERLGAATWRAFAEQEQKPSARQTFLSCAELEEASAAVLESYLAGAA